MMPGEASVLLSLLSATGGGDTAFLHWPISGLPHPHKGKHESRMLDKHSDWRRVMRLTLLLLRFAGECDGSLDTQPNRCSVSCGHQSQESRCTLGNLL